MTTVLTLYEITLNEKQITPILILTISIMAIILLIFTFLPILIRYLNSLKIPKNLPSNIPDNLKIKKNKKGFYTIKNKKYKYLSKNQVIKLYHNYINPLKLSKSDYPSRVVKI